MTRKRNWNPAPDPPLVALGTAAGYYTRAQRAEALGYSVSHVAHCEQGAAIPGMEMIERMSSLYGVSPEAVTEAAKATLAMRMAV